MIKLQEAERICEEIQKEIPCEIIGSVWRKHHSEVHDIDLLVKEKDWKPPNFRFPQVMIEFYIVNDEFYERFKWVMRQGMYNIINERLMTGLHYKKIIM